MSALSDKVLYEMSHEGVEPADFTFLSKNYVYVSDINNLNYSSNQVIFDLQAMSTNNKFIDWQNATLAIPLVLTVAGSVAGVMPDLTPENAWCASLKSGIHHLIHSVSLELNQNTIVSIVPFQNLYSNFKLLTEWSQQDLDTLGPSILFDKETSRSARYSSAIANGCYSGSQNVQIAGNPVFLPASGWGNFNCNEGRLRRMQRTSFNDSDVAIDDMNDATKSSQLLKDRVAFQGMNGTVYHMLALFKMPMLHDYFKKCPLIKNASYKLILNMNINCTATCSISGAGALTGMSVSSPNGVIPFQLSPILAAGGSGLDAGAVAGNIVATLNIGKSATIIGQASFDHPLTACRMYLPQVQMTPEYTSKYLSSPRKTIYYNDIMTFNGNQLQNIPSGNTVNTVLTNGLSRLRRLIIYPFYDSSVCGSIHPYNSPFASEPATCSPFAHIKDFNVYISGQPVYPQNQVYKFEEFHNELVSTGAINGGQVRGLTSGLLNQSDFDSAYPFVVVNLQRHLESDDNVPQSVSVMFSNWCKLACSYIIQIEYEREVTINADTGLIEA